MSKPVIRKASAADASAITKVINLAFGEAEKFFIDGDRITEAEVEAYLRLGHFLIAEGAPDLLGCVYVEPRQTRAYLGLLSVNPNQQTRGTGSLLLSEAEDFCRNQGCNFMDILIVNQRKELFGFYEKRGYVENGTTPFPPEAQTKLPCHFINMTKQLDVS